jgi:hypothetical protein
MFAAAWIRLLDMWLQQPPEDMDVPVVEGIPVVGHGLVVVGVETTDGRLCMVMFGNGLRPPVESSVDPIGIPTRPTVDREPTLGDDAVALDDVVEPVAQVPDAVPAMPAPSNSGVGAIVPDIAPVADVPVIEPPVPVVELPSPDDAVCIEPAPLEQAVAVVIAFAGDELDAVGLTPGVASSVAPSGIPVAPTGAADPIPSGEVTPRGSVVPAPMPTWANAMPRSNWDQTTATIKRLLMDASYYCLRVDL